MIRFAKEFDARITFNLGHQRENPTEVLKNMFNVKELDGVFTAEFKKMIEKSILKDL